MSKNFSKKDGVLGAKKVKQSTLPKALSDALASIAAPKTSELSLPEKFLNWLDRSARVRRAFVRRPQGIDGLEARVLLSGDPLTAAWSVAADAALRVSEVQYDADPGDAIDTQSELRLQLVEGLSAGGNNVVSEFSVRVVDGTKRVVALDAAGNVADVYGKLVLTGTNAANSLLLDQSVLSLAEGLELEINLGGGADTLVGPEVSNGFVWSINSASAGAVSGEMAVLLPTGSVQTAETEDKSIDHKVTYAGGRDHFLTYSGIETIEMKATRDVLVDNRSNAAEWQLTWNSADKNTTIRQFGSTSAVGSFESTQAARATQFNFVGVEAFKGSAGAHLNLHDQNVAAGSTGASINAESGEVRLFAPGDAGRENPIILDVRNVTSFTGTGGKDEARAAHGVSINLAGGADVLAGNDDLLTWTVSNLAASGDPEARVTIDFSRPATEGRTDAELAAMTEAERSAWRSLNLSGQYFGVDAIIGGDSDDRLVLDYGRAVKVELRGTVDEAELFVSEAAGGGAVFKAQSISQLQATFASAGTGTNFSVLDYSALGATDITVDLGLNTASGFGFISGFDGIITGAGADNITATSTTRLIQTGGGDDVVGLDLVGDGRTLAIDMGAGSDKLIGDADAEIGVNSALTVANPSLANPVATKFLVNLRAADGFSGSGSFTYSDNYEWDAVEKVFVNLINPPAPVQTGGTVTFAGVDNLEGKGSRDDADTLTVQGANSADPLTWYASEVYKGAVAWAGGLLTYSGIARGVAQSAQVTLSYGGTTGVEGYNAGVTTDLTDTDFVTGFKYFDAPVYELIGSKFSDVLIGNASTKILRGGEGIDALGLQSVDGAQVYGGVGEEDTVTFLNVTGAVTLTDSALKEGSFTATLDGIESAFLIASTTTTNNVVIDASAFTLGNVVLGGGRGNDRITGTQRLGDTIFGSLGDDTIAGYSSAGQTGTGSDIYIEKNIVGNRALAGSTAASLTIAATVNGSAQGTSTLTAIGKVKLVGGDGHNLLDGTGLTTTAFDLELQGGAGNDTLIGGAGDDTLSGGMGTDSFDGRGGIDVLLEDGFLQYDLNASGLYTDDMGAPGKLAFTGDKIQLDFPAATASDTFRITLTGPNGLSITTPDLRFDASDAAVLNAIMQTQQFDYTTYKTTVQRDAAGLVTGVTFEFILSMAGRSQGYDLQATTRIGGVAGTATRVFTAATRGGLAREAVSNIEALDFTFFAEAAGFADVSTVNMTATIKGTKHGDLILAKIGDSISAGDGDDNITLRNTAPDPTGAMVDGGEGFDRIRVISGNQDLRNSTITASNVTTSHENIENFILEGSAGADVLDARNFNASALTGQTLLRNLGGGQGLPISAGNDFKVTFPDGSTAFVDIPLTATTMQDVLDAFKAVAGMEGSSIANGTLILTTTKTGAGSFKVEAVAETETSTDETGATVVRDLDVDSSALQALGLEGAIGVVGAQGGTITTRMSSGVGVMFLTGLGNDLVYGSDGDDLIVNGGGNDLIDGRGGRDHYIANQNGAAGNFLLTRSGATVTVTLSGVGIGSATDVEVFEVRGDASVNTFGSSNMTGDVIYRTGGGADTVALSGGGDTIIVDGLAALAAGAKVTVTGTASAGDKIFLALDGDVTSALLSRLDNLANVEVTLGATPMRADVLYQTRVDDSVQNSLRVASGQTVALGAGRWTWAAKAILIEGTLRSHVDNLSEMTLIFDTTDFKVAAGGSIVTTGDIIISADKRDRRWTTGMYQVQDLDASILIGEAGATDLAILKGRNVIIDMRVGVMPVTDVAAANGVRPFNFGSFLGETILDIAESLMLIATSNRVFSTLRITTAAASKVEADEDYKVTISTNLVTKSKPIPIAVGIAINVVTVDQRISLEGAVTVGRDMVVGSYFDMLSTAVVTNPGLLNIVGISFALNYNNIQNHVLVSVDRDSTIGRDMRVAAHTIKRVYGEVNTTMPLDGMVSTSFAIETSFGATTARVASPHLTVGRHLSVEASSQKKMATILRPSLVLTMYATGVNAVASNGFSTANVLDTVLDPLTPTVTNGISSIVFKVVNSYIVPTEFVKKILAEGPKRPPIQVSGAIAVAVDESAVNAALGFEDGRASEYVVGGNTTIYASALARPKAITMALTSNEGSEVNKKRAEKFGLAVLDRDPQKQNPVGASISVNVSAYSQTARARIEDNVTLASDGKVSVLSNALNKINPNELWGANIVTPFLAKTAFKIGKSVTDSNGNVIADGVVNIAIGDIVEKDGKTYVAQVAQNNLDLRAENLDDSARWAITGGTGGSTFKTTAAYIGSLLNYFDNNFGLASGLTDTWTQSYARGEKAGIAISASVMNLDYNAKSEIGDGVIITAGNVGGRADVVVKSESRSDNLSLAGNFVPAGFRQNFPVQVQDKMGWWANVKKGAGIYADHLKNNFGNIKNGKFGDHREDSDLVRPMAAIGASVQVVRDKVHASTAIGNVTITARKLDATATADIFSMSLSVAGGKGGKLSLNGSWNHMQTDTLAAASINGRSTITLTNDLNLIAKEKAYIFAFGGAASIADSVAIGVSGVTMAGSRGAKAVIDTDISGETNSGIFASGNVNVNASVDGVVILASVAATKAGSSGPEASDPPLDQGPQQSKQDALRDLFNNTFDEGAYRQGMYWGPHGNTSLVPKDSPKATSGVGISGAATVLQEDITVQATVRNLVALQAGEVAVTALDRATRVLIAGAGAIAEGDKGVGISGSVVVIDSSKLVEALIANSLAAMSLTASKVAVRANDEADYFSLAAGMAAAKGEKGIGVSGSVVIIVSDTAVRARLEGKDTADRISLNNGPVLDISARSNASWTQIAGAAAYGGAVGVGVSVAVTVVKTVAQSSMEHLHMGATNATVGAVSLTAVNSVSVNTVAAGVAASKGSASGGGAGVGMVAINVVQTSTTADVIDTHLTTSGANGMNLIASDDSYVAAGAGGLALTGGKGAVGIAVALNIVVAAKPDGITERGTELRVMGSDLRTGTGHLGLGVASDLDMVAVAISAAGARTAAVAGSAAANRYNLATRLIVDEESSLTSGYSFAATAQQNAAYVALAGGVAVALSSPDSASAGVGAAVALNLISAPVEVVMNGNLSVADASTILASAQQTLVTIAVGGAGSGGFALGGSVAVSELDGSVTATANPTTARVWTVREMVFASQESSTVTNIAGAAGISYGRGGVGAAVSVISNTRDVQTLVSGELSITAGKYLDIRAGVSMPAGGISNDLRNRSFAALPNDAFNPDTGLNRSDLNAQMVNIGFAAGGSKMVGVGFNLAMTTVDRDISAKLAGNVVVTLNDTGSAAQLSTDSSVVTSGLSVIADDASSITVVSIGAAAAIGMGSPVAISVAGSVAVSDISSKVLAEITTAGAITLNNEADLRLLARNETQIVSVSLGAAVSVAGQLGAGAVGFSVAVNRISTETGARLSSSVTGGVQNLVAVDVENDSKIISVSIAAAVAVTTGQVALAGGGAGSGNYLKGATYAIVSNANLAGIGKLDVFADSTGTVRAVVLGIAVSVAAGSAGGAGSLGVAVAINKTEGLSATPSGLEEGSGYLTAARVVGGDITVSGPLNIAAKSTQLIRADVVAASVAVAATGGFSLSVAGAGAAARNEGSSNVWADLRGTFR